MSDAAGSGADAVRYLERLVGYHAWLGRELVEVASAVAPEDLARESLSQGGVLETLEHMLDVTWSWRRAAEGLLVDGVEGAPADLEGLPAIEAYWAAENARLDAFVGSLTPAGLDRPVTPPWKTRSFRTWDIVLHTVLHAADHANEVGWALTRLGRSPGELGYMRWVDLHRDALDVPPEHPR